jgi:hypothetical protein
MILYHGSNVEIRQADDKVGVQIRNFMEGNISIDVFLERLKFIKGITFQYFFGTEKAIKLLKRL